MHRLLSITLLVFLAGTFAPVAVAQKRSGWDVDCRVDKMTDKKSCTIGTVLRGVGDSADSLTVAHLVPDGTFVVIAGEVCGQARIRVDQHSPITLTLRAKDFCFLDTSGSALLRQMRAGSRILVDYVRPFGQSIGPLEGSLSGFDAAYQQALAEQRKR